MFYGISQGKMPLDGFRIKHVLKDIQSLNRDALKGKHHITAISTAAYPLVADKYWILSVGASVGRRYGPILVCRPEKMKALKASDWSSLRIATPGPLTTALLLLRLFRKDFISVNKPFDRILHAVKAGQVDAGLVIHEGQLTYKKWGFQKVLDLGRWWHEETALPIPLGLDVVRKDLGRSEAARLAGLLSESIRLAYKNKKDSVRYALKFGRGINAKVGEKFVKMYVNRDTLDMGVEGEEALKELFRRARRAGILRAPCAPEVIRP
ncbi:MAG: ABC transporter substrate-binding protein [Elusimicrobia bacterium]|nr:ABC transporter substrate-binding protein [Elusimicrobiota bacterium]